MRSPSHHIIRIVFPVFFVGGRGGGRGGGSVDAQALDGCIVFISRILNTGGRGISQFPVLFRVVVVDTI